MPNYKYAPLNLDTHAGDSTSDGPNGDSGSDPFSKKRDLCVGL